MSVGYGTAKKPLPIVTGQDAEIPSVKSILAGEQTSTVFKDTRTLAIVLLDLHKLCGDVRKRSEIVATWITWGAEDHHLTSYQLDVLARLYAELFKNEPATTEWPR